MTTTASGPPDDPVPGDLLELADGRRIHGVADEGYGPLVDVFVANFVERHDVGAGCAVYVDGRRVVDLWGGVADSRTGRSWEHDTAAVIFSCAKGALAICAYLLVEDGRLDLDAPIARYWPSFGGQGKAGITVRDAMAHRAGLPALDVDLTRDEVLAWDPVLRAIESQRPAYPPYAGHLYHAMTYGWLLGEIIHRTGGRCQADSFAARSAIAWPCACGLGCRQHSGTAWPGWSPRYRTRTRAPRARAAGWPRTVRSWHGACRWAARSSFQPSTGT